jgi:proteic killer suppression protein
MIRSFRHRGLKRLYESDDRSGIRPDLVDTIQEITTPLPAGAWPSRVPASPDERRPERFGSVTVRANWRIVFRFDGADAFDAELIDDH